MLLPTFRYFLKDVPLSLLFGSAIVLNLAAWIFVFWAMPAPSEQAFLHYTVYFGIDWIGPWRLMFFLPLSGTVLGVVNNALAALAYRNQKMLSYFFASATAAIQILLFAEVLLLWRFNG